MMIAASILVCSGIEEKTMVEMPIWMFSFIVPLTIIGTMGIVLMLLHCIERMCDRRWR